MSEKLISEIIIDPNPRSKRGDQIASASFVLFEKIQFNLVAIHPDVRGGMRLVYPRQRNVDVCRLVNRNLEDTIQRAVIAEALKYGLLEERQ